MNAPAHKRPRKAVMRVAMLDASVTGRSGVLLDRARSYLTGDEVFEELYAHAVDLEAKIDEVDDEMTAYREGADEHKEAKDDLRREVDSVIDDLKRKANDADAVRKRFSSALEDDIPELLDKALAMPAAAGDLADLLMEIQKRVRALADDVDDIPELDEQIDTLKEAHKAAE